MDIPQNHKTVFQLGDIADKSRILGLLILAALWLVSSLFLIFRGEFGGKELFLVENQLAPESVSAEFDFKYLDSKASAAKRGQAEHDEPLSYVIKGDVCEASLADAEKFFDQILLRSEAMESGKAFVPTPGDAAAEQAASLSEAAVKSLLIILRDPQKRKLLLERLSTVLYKGVVSQAELDKMRDQGSSVRIIDKDGRIRSPQPISYIQTPMAAATSLYQSVSKDYSPKNRKSIEQAIFETTPFVIHENLVFDAATTARDKELTAKSKDNDVYAAIKRGDPIIRKGEKVSLETIERLDAYNKECSSRRADPRHWRGMAIASLTSLALILLAGIYFHSGNPDILTSNKKAGTAAVVMIVSLLCSMLAVMAFSLLAGAFSIPPEFRTFAIPLALPALLLTPLLGSRGALYVGMLLAMLAAIRLGDMMVVPAGMAVSCAVAFSVDSARNYKSYFIRALMSAAASCMLMDALSLWAHGAPLDATPAAALAGFCNGTITAAAALLLLFVIESVFQTSTNMSLLNLCDYNHPLLKRLQLEAPGTYHHSLVVATLAEQAADTIGANPVKARACALFHDIGKLASPLHFTENNIGAESPHDRLGPRRSASIIISHVAEGSDLARRSKLPKIVKDCVEQHHGDELVYFFYRKALDKQAQTPDAPPVPEKDFRYQGDPPKNKEVTIVNLADACEAASRSISDTSKASVDSLVWDIMRRKIKDGQLDNADLTFGELAEIRESFVKTISSMRHGRVKYPKDKDDDDNNPV